MNLYKKQYPTLPASSDNKGSFNILFLMNILVSTLYDIITEFFQNESTSKKVIIFTLILLIPLTGKSNFF